MQDEFLSCANGARYCNATPLRADPGKKIEFPDFPFPTSPPWEVGNGEIWGIEGCKFSSDIYVFGVILAVMYLIWMWLCL